MTRREFCWSAAAASMFASVPSLASNQPRGSVSRWYKGNLHCHTYWSDGRGFPEDAATAYKSLGYDFLAVTDHNRFGVDTECWKDVCAEEGSWPPKVSQAVFDHYVKTFAHAQTRTTDGKTQVRLMPFDELKAKYDEAGKFLLIPGCEVTYSMPGGNRRDLHVNTIGVPGVIPDVAKDYYIATRKDQSVLDVARKAFEEYTKLRADKGNPPSFFMVNHPHWPILDVSAQDLLAMPKVRYFEVCNSGADYPPPDGMIDDGFENDRLWDVVNAFRAKRGEKLLMAVGTDDSHWYPGNGHARGDHLTCTPGDSWVCVKAESLTPSALFAAMDRGDFYASSGVALEDVSFDGRSLSVSVPAKPGVSYTVKFIVSKCAFSETPVRTLELTFPENRSRSVPVYDDKVGRIAETIVGKPGEAIHASYTLKLCDLYVRARVESSEPPFAAAKFHPKMMCAWTQPYTAK